ncbi:MAG TPA: hypothetical protein VE988_20825 [Gemmataceae bacterium]|nr:hypothetical protein [Gemmataceae bacterium]
MSLLVRRCLNHAHLLEQLVETWQFDHQADMCAHDLGELVSECLDQAQLCRRAWKSLLKKTFDEREPDDKIFAAEEAVKVSVQRAASAFKLIQKLVEFAEQDGKVVERAAEFKQAAHDLEALAKEVDQRLTFDPKMFEESLAAFKRGEYVLIEDLIHELQGGSAKAD